MRGYPGEIDWSQAAVHGPEHLAAASVAGCGCSGARAEGSSATSARRQAVLDAFAGPTALPGGQTHATMDNTLSNVPAELELNISGHLVEIEPEVVGESDDQPRCHPKRETNASVSTTGDVAPEARFSPVEQDAFSAQEEFRYLQDGLLFHRLPPDLARKWPNHAQFMDDPAFTWRYMRAGWNTYCEENRSLWHVPQVADPNSTNGWIVHALRPYVVYHTLGSGAKAGTDGNMHYWFRTRLWAGVTFHFSYFPDIGDRTNLDRADLPDELEPDSDDSAIGFRTLYQMLLLPHVRCHARWGGWSSQRGGPWPYNVVEYGCGYRDGFTLVTQDSDGDGVLDGWVHCEYGIPNGVTFDLTPCGFSDPDAIDPLTGEASRMSALLGGSVRGQVRTTVRDTVYTGESDIRRQAFYELFGEKLVIEHRAAWCGPGGMRANSAGDPYYVTNRFCLRAEDMTHWHALTDEVASKITGGRTSYLFQARDSINLQDEIERASAYPGWDNWHGHT